MICSKPLDQFLIVLKSCTGQEIRVSYEFREWCDILQPSTHTHTHKLDIVILLISDANNLKCLKNRIFTDKLQGVVWCQLFESLQVKRPGSLEKERIAYTIYPNHFPLAQCNVCNVFRS